MLCRVTKFSDNLRVHLPQEQGLRLRYNFNQLLQRCRLRVHLPQEQGLRQLIEILFFGKGRLRVHLPQEQGLRQKLF